MRGHPLNRAQKLAIRTLLLQGYSVPLIAKALSLSENTIYRWKSKHIALLDKEHDEEY